MQVDLTGYRAGAPTINAVQRSLILKTFPGFVGLGGTELAILANIVQERFFRKGERLHTPGHPVEALHLIVDGEVRSFKRGVPIQTFGPRSAVGGLAALTHDPRGADVVALSDVFALELNNEDMSEIFEEHLSITFGVIGAMARSLRELQEVHGLSRMRARDFPDFAHDDAPLGLVEKMFFLRRSTNFGETGIEALAALAEGANEVRFAAGDRIWDAGDPANHSLMLVSGELEAHPPGHEAFVFTSGWVVGGIDSLGQVPRWYGVDAKTDIVALELPRAQLQDVLEDFPDMATMLLTSLATGLSGMLDRIASSSSRASEPPGNAD